MSPEMNEFFYGQDKDDEKNEKRKKEE